MMETIADRYRVWQRDRLVKTGTDRNNRDRCRPLQTVTSRYSLLQTVTEILTDRYRPLQTFTDRYTDRGRPLQAAPLVKAKLP